MNLYSGIKVLIQVLIHLYSGIKVLIQELINIYKIIHPASTTNTTPDDYGMITQSI